MNLDFFVRKIKELSAFFQNNKKNYSVNPELYLHIGLPKTGTSAIQNFFFQNREILLKQGVLYPDYALHWSQHVALAKAILSPLFPDAQFNNLVPTVDMSSWYEKQQSDLALRKYSKVVISSEFFWAAPAMQSGMKYHAPTTENFDLLERAVSAYKTAFSKFDKVKIILYLRRQDQWLESFFNQQIKDGFPIPCDEDILPLKIYLLFSRNLNLWEKYFGKENIKVRNFSVCRGDVVKDFCTILDIKEDDRFVFSQAGSLTENLRLSARAIKSMRMAIEKKMNKETLDLLREVLRYTSSRIKDVSTSGVFSPEFHQQVFSLYEQDNKALAERYPICADFCQADVPDSCQSEAADPVSPEEQVEILLERLMLNIAEESHL